MANLGEEGISILAGNSNSGLSYLITTVTSILIIQIQGLLKSSPWMNST